MAENDSSASWNSHQWLGHRPRRFELESGQSIVASHCSACGRDFVTDESSGAHFAARVSIFSFYRLYDEVTQRWVNERCPGKRLPTDDDDRKRKTIELRIAWDRSCGEQQNLLANAGSPPGLAVQEIDSEALAAECPRQKNLDRNNKPPGGLRRSRWRK